MCPGPQKFFLCFEKVLLGVEKVLLGVAKVLFTSKKLIFGLQELICGSAEVLFMHLLSKSSFHLTKVDFEYCESLFED